MKKTVIAFDVDGTLIGGVKNITDEVISIFPNKRIVSLLEILSSFKNVKIIVWSGQGEHWARQVCELLNIQRLVNGYASKNHKGKDEDGKHIFEPAFTPDIAIDDIQACELGMINLIVREK